MKLHTDLIFLLSSHPLHSFLQISDKLSTKRDSEVDINLKLSINFNLYVIVLPLSSFLLIGTEKVLDFSVFSPKHSSWPSNSFDSLLIMSL